MLGLVVGLAGFNTQEDTFFAPSFKQSITAGAIKIVMVMMLFIYVGAAFVLEFGGLGLRYLMAKAGVYFVTETGNRQKKQD